MCVERKAKKMLESLKNSVYKEQFMDPDGGYIFMSTERRKTIDIEIKVLKRVLEGV